MIFSLSRVTWAPILHAASIWFSQGGGMENISAEKVELDVTGSDTIKVLLFIFISLKHL